MILHRMTVVHLKVLMIWSKPGNTAANGPRALRCFIKRMMKTRKFWLKCTIDFIPL